MDLRRVTVLPPAAPTNLAAVDATPLHPSSPTSPANSDPSWLSRYRRKLIATDLVVVALAVLFAQYTDAVGTTDAVSAAGRNWLFSFLLVTAWMSSFAIEGVWDEHVVGAGPAEFRRVITSSLMLGAVVAIVAYLTMAAIARSYLLIALPLGFAGVLVGHWCWRRRLGSQRKSGHQLRVLLVAGNLVGVRSLITQVRDDPSTGYRVDGVCLIDGACGGLESQAVLDVPVFGRLPDIASAANKIGASALAVTTSAGFDAECLPELSFRLQGSGVRLMVSPEIANNSVSPMHFVPVAGLPLVHVGEPRFRGGRAVTKRMLDLIVASVSLIVLFPFMVLAGLAVLAADGLPILHDDEFVGRAGRRFRAWKFRCSPHGAKARLARVTVPPTVPDGCVLGPAVITIEPAPRGNRPGRLGDHPKSTGAVGAEALISRDMGVLTTGVLPTSTTIPTRSVERHGQVDHPDQDRRDSAPAESVVYQLSPTRVGRLLRRSGIDEAPMLVSVLLGHLSLVGPEARIPGSVPIQQMQLRVRPGITGPWRVQASATAGKPSATSKAEDRARMDFYDVENWSVLSDLMFLAKTVRQTIAGGVRNEGR